ncbi:histidine phosphatase family protein [Zhihengliuella sp.]|uniref:histidine phosphatase family protein n=1 Tax=Zhihengliuella sp. TaxID=1954483 RepID=UPI00281142C6|nr:histidine phosphatase family protein [Zhihengliuella sp.]
MPNQPRLWVVRHGETEWSRSGQYTGLTDMPLTPDGEAQSRVVGQKLANFGIEFNLVLTSPLGRARSTAELAGFAGAEVVREAHEWDYGDYEGIESNEIRRRTPSYVIWDDGVPNGELLDDVAARADAVIERVRTELDDDGHALLFTHGHFSRVVAARWLGLPADRGRHFVLGTAQVSRLGWDKKTPVIEAWGL